MEADLIPVSEWIYDLYEVTYWSGEPDDRNRRLLQTLRLASSCSSHLLSDINERAPSACEYFNYNVIKENVGAPRIIGRIHGLPLYEDSLSHARRLSCTNL